jgi:hypothetical protein
MAQQLALAFIMPGKVQHGLSLTPTYPCQVSQSRADGLMYLVSDLCLPAQTGLPVASLDYITLPYFCNALSCFYTTLIISAGLHITGLFPLTHVIDNFGPLMSVSMICGFVLSTIVYFGCIFFHWGGKPLRMSGNFFYDFFMGGAFDPSGRIGCVLEGKRLIYLVQFCSSSQPSIGQGRPQGTLYLSFTPQSLR